MEQSTGGSERWAWTDERTIEIDGQRFVGGTMPMGIGPDELLVFKSRQLIQKYLDLVASDQPRRIVELGVKEGGSTAMLALLAQPEVLLAVELSAEVPPQLDRFRAERGLEGRLRTEFGLDQGDRAALAAAVDRHLPDHGIDLVIDDASHILGPTRASFEVLFPRLRPGGIYVVEDWDSELIAAAHLHRVMPDAHNLDERIAAASDVLHVLNAPDRELPPEVVQAMTDIAREDLLERAGPASFDGLFTLLVEAAGRAEVAVRPDAEPGRVRPLADLGVELAIIAATAPEAVAEVRFDSGWLSVRRGPGPLPTEGFRLGEIWTDSFGYLR